MIHSGKSITHFCFLVIIFFCISAPAFGEINVFGQSYCFTLSGGPGFLYGTSYEIVYRNSGSKEYLSELQWNFKPLFFLGLNLDFAQKNPKAAWGFFTGIGLKAGIPMETGVMEDRDWMSPCTVPGSLTHFSSHENHTKAAFLLNLDAGFSFPVWKLVLKFYFNFDYMYFKWEGRNGYVQYGTNNYEYDPLPPNNIPYDPWNSGFQKIAISGLGISYAQHWLLFSLGTGVEFSLDRFTFSAVFFAGLPLCIAIDDHHMRSPPFRATGLLSQGFAIKPKLGVSFSITDRFAIGLYAAYLFIGETRGDTKFKESGKSVVWYKNAEGASLKALNISLAVKYQL